MQRHLEMIKTNRAAELLQNISSQALTGISHDRKNGSHPWRANLTEEKERLSLQIQHERTIKI